MAFKNHKEEFASDQEQCAQEKVSNWSFQIASNISDLGNTRGKSSHFERRSVA